MNRHIERGASAPLSDINQHVQVSREFLEFLDWIEEREMGFPPGVKDICEKPWNWQVEFTQFLKARGQ